MSRYEQCEVNTCDARKYEQGTPEWLEMRRTKITATDVPIILGENPYTTPYQLWHQKMGFETVEVNRAMQFGIDNEDAARERYIESTGLEMAPMVVIHPEYDWLMASLDGVTFDRKYACEIKSIMSASKFGTEIPKYHQMQMEVQACCLGIDSIDYIRDDGFDQEIIKYEADPNFINNNIDKLKDFYRCIVENVPSPLSNRDYPHRNDFDWTSTMSRYLYLDNLVKQYQEEMKELKNHLVDISEGQPSQGGGGKLCKITRKGNIDYGKIEALKELDLEQYRKPDSEFWSIKSNGNPA